MVTITFHSAHHYLFWVLSFLFEFHCSEMTSDCVNLQALSLLASVRSSSRVVEIRDSGVANNQMNLQLITHFR